jgi:L-alanine-DL-glutamate epimerase-like enolase superfamily enzyme
MDIASLAFSRLDIPFRVAFKHSSATRSTTQAILVNACSDGGLAGHGEGCPREYVTGESLSTAEAFFNRHQAELVEQVSDVKTLRTWIKRNAETLNQNPAAWCACELALLDLMGKAQQSGVEGLLGIKPLLPVFQYTAVLGDGSSAGFRKTLLQYRHMGFSDFKLKLSGDLEHDRIRADILLETMGERDRLRLDANNLWNSAGQAAPYLAALQLPFFALEEPLQAFDYSGLYELSSAAGCQIILDESLLTADHLHSLPGPASTWIANIRVSKMGGVLRSLGVVEAAAVAGIDIIVGAQVGETSLLTRAAMTIASQVGESLIAQEGAFGTLLLEYDLCEPSLMLGPGGLLKTAEFDWLHGAGFGLPISSERWFST